MIRLREAWWRLHGERPLVITFWPQDYACGTVYVAERHLYHITHYGHSADPHFFVVWGSPKPRGVRVDPFTEALIERRPDLMPRIRQHSRHP